MFGFVAAEVAAVTHADASSRRALRRCGRRGRCRAVRRRSGRVPRRLDDPLEPGTAISQVLATGAAARSDPAKTGDGTVARRMLAGGYTGAEAAPIAVSGRPWGAVVVGGRDAASLPEEPARALAPFADLLSRAVAGAARASSFSSRARGS